MLSLSPMACTAMMPLWLWVLFLWMSGRHEGHCLPFVCAQYVRVHAAKPGEQEHKRLLLCTAAAMLFCVNAYQEEYYSRYSTHHRSN